MNAPILLQLLCGWNSSTKRGVEEERKILLQQFTSTKVQYNIDPDLNMMLSVVTERIQYCVHVGVEPFTSYLIKPSLCASRLFHHPFYLLLLE